MTETTKNGTSARRNPTTLYLTGKAQITKKNTWKFTYRHMLYLQNTTPIGFNEQMRTKLAEPLTTYKSITITFYVIYCVELRTHNL